MSVNLYLDSNLDGVLDPSFESAYLIREFNQKLSHIDEAFNQLLKYINHASTAKLIKLIAEWEIIEPENATEIKITFWMAQCLNEAVKLSVDCVCSKISGWFFQMSLEKLLKILFSNLIHCSEKDLNERKVFEVRERLKGALINWKVSHTQLLRQEYSEKLFMFQ